MLVEGVENFQYLGHLLNEIDDEYMSVLWNIKRAQRVWGS